MTTHRAIQIIILWLTTIPVSVIGYANGFNMPVQNWWWLVGCHLYVFCIPLVINYADGAKRKPNDRRR